MSVNYFETLNPAQQKAVKQTDGPIMVIAGAGSGKTRVLTYKIAYLLQQGVDAFNIMALTFTNKAAKEMKSRVYELIKSSEADNVNMGTFHSIFAKLLREDGYYLGYNRNFTIYNRDDSKALIKKIVKDFKLDPKLYDHKTIISRISAAKSNLISALEYNEDKEIMELDINFNRPAMGKIYMEYQKQLFRSNAMDFDDILFNFFNLIKKFPEVLTRYQQMFKYIMIDEFQDTNKAQYEIVKKLAIPENNICVVGDDAQSIYAFRGASIANILGFTKDYPAHKVFKLEQNYRSTNHIVQISNSIINKNKNQLKKNVWTENIDGEKIRINKSVSDTVEARMIASGIFERKMNEHCEHHDFAILYRTNSQSRKFEDELRKLNIPYYIFNGVSFYQRKEIKDLLAYFRLIINHQDQEALTRIINYPPRGLGDVTLTKIFNKAFDLERGVWDTINDKVALSEIPLNKGTINKIENFVAMINYFAHKLAVTDAVELAKEVTRMTGLLKQLREEDESVDSSKVENIGSLINAISDFIEQQNSNIAEENEGEIKDEIVTLDSFMQDVALLSDADTSDKNTNDKVQMMTIHAAKGLEFKHVYVVGLEEDLFPSQMALNSREELEEERRLFYVACTRAEKTLTLSYAENRNKWGNMLPADASRFLKDLDYNHVHEVPSDLNKTNFGIHSIHGFNISADSNKETTIPTKRVLKPLKETQNTNVNSSAKKVIEELRVDNIVEHNKFGIGKVINVEGVGLDKKAKIDFEKVGLKQMLLKFANLKIIR